MGFLSIFDISAAGMNIERMRLDVSAVNLANANTTTNASGGGFKPLEVVATQSTGLPTMLSFESYIKDNLNQLIPHAEVKQMEVSPRMVFEPNHPDADERGYVAYPGINPVSEMVKLVAITRAYEANIRAMDAARTMAQRALDIGSEK